jgi:2,3-bisphosphoglycerate-independent phosphoglycerate mutase
MGESEYQLKPHPTIHKPDKPLLVVVLDGWGEAEDDQYNAISRADTPCMDSLKKSAPDRWMLLKAHGTAVGLPSDDDMGNSEVTEVAKKRLLMFLVHHPAACQCQAKAITQS